MDFAAIDLDPMAEAPFSRVRDVARWVHDELDALGVPGWLKTSGSRGLHIYLPLRPGTPYESGMLFCQIVASFVVAPAPRGGDGRADRQASAIPRPSTSTACRTSRARRWPAPTARAPATTPGASTPLAWDELDDRALDPRAFTIKTLPGAPGARWAISGPACAQAPGIDLEAALERAQGAHGSLTKILGRRPLVVRVAAVKPT